MFKLTTDRAASASDDRIRILYFRDTNFVCGPGKTIINTFRTIDKGRFAPTIGVPVNGVATNAFLDRAREVGAQTLTVKMRHALDLGVVFRLARILRREGIHIIQSHDSLTRRIAALAALLAGTAHVSSLHGWLTNTRKERFARALDLWLIRRSRQVVVVSERLRDELVSLGVTPSKINLLRNAILLEDYPTDFASNRVRSELGLGNSKVVGIVGRLSPEKAHDLFLDMAARVRAAIPDARFLIVGDGPLRADIDARIRELGLEGSVIVTGHRSDMLDLYAAMDALVLCSITEGLPNVVLEAFACSKPVVATRVGGVPELVVDRETGFLVEPGDLEALVDRVLRLLADEGLAATLARNGRRRIEEMFSFRERTRQLEMFYEQMTGKNHVRPRRRR